MLLIVACVLFVIWLLAVVAFKLTRGVIHLVLVIALVAIVIHFLRHA
jgi:hypothetical protein